MKRFILIFVLTSIFFTCVAPELSPAAKTDKVKFAVKEIARWAYEKEFKRFALHIKMKESPSPTAINQIGCMGSFQFAPATLRSLGYGHITPDKFRQDPSIFPEELQFKVLKDLVRSNAVVLEKYMSFVGKTIGGVLITRSGLLGGAHLGGAGGVITFLLSEGRVNYSDMNGTSIKDYIREFQGYNV